MLEISMQEMLALVAQTQPRSGLMDKQFWAFGGAGVMAATKRPPRVRESALHNGAMAAHRNLDHIFLV